MKGELSVDPSFHPLAIKKPTIHLRNPLVALDPHRLHYSGKSVPWSSKHIINCTYSPQLDVMMLLCSDWKIYVYNRNLDLLTKLSDWQSKYSVGFQFVEELSMFLLIGVIEIQAMKVSIKTNLKETKFLSSIKFNIERKELRAVEKDKRLSWNKGYGYDLAQNLLYVWSNRDIHFYSITKLEMMSKITKLVKKQAAITQVHLNRTYRYTITGLINGNLKVWRLPLSPITSQTAQYIMIHNCIHHTRAVQKIVPASDHRLVLSSSQDLTLCLWSLQTFELLRAYNFEGEYTSVFLVDQSKAFAIQNNQLGELVFGKTMEFIMEVQSSISYFDKAVCDNSWSSFQITLESNVGIQIRKRQLEKADLNKMEVGYFYPPLKAQSIRQVIASPYHPSTYYMLVQKGQLFSLRFQQNSSKIEHSFSIQHAHDSQSHSLNQTPTFLAFPQIPNINFDSQITQSTLPNKQTVLAINDLAIQSASRQYKLIMIGCNKGSIVVISLDQIDRIRARLTYHREMIVNIQMIRGQKSGYIMASICAQNYLRLTHLELDKASCFFSVYFGQNLKFIRSFEDKLAVVFKKGIFQIATAVASEQMQVIQNIDAVDHEGQIHSIDIEPNKRLLMTCGSDNRIKIWSTLKILIYEIKLDQGLRYAIWSNKLQIFVAHNNKLLYLRDFTFDADDIDDERNIQIQDDKRFVRVGLKDYFDIIKKDQGIAVKKYANIDQQYEEIIQKTRKKGFSQSFAKTGGKKQQQKVENKSRAASFLVDQYELKGSQKVTKKKKSMKGKPISASHSLAIRTQEQIKRDADFQQKVKATHKHMQQINEMKKQTNERLLPKISSKHQDKFEEFISEKLINKKMLTRRDITLNRIIMKNLIKEQFSQEEDEVNNLKLDF